MKKKNKKTAGEGLVSGIEIYNENDLINPNGDIHWTRGWWRRDGPVISYPFSGDNWEGYIIPINHYDFTIVLIYKENVWHIPIKVDRNTWGRWLYMNTLCCLDTFPDSKFLV